MSTRFIQETIKENLPINQTSYVKISDEGLAPGLPESRPMIKTNLLSEFAHANLNKYSSGMDHVTRGKSVNKDVSTKPYKIFDNIGPKNHLASNSKATKVAQFALPTESQSEEDSMTNYNLVKSSRNF